MIQHEAEKENIGHSNVRVLPTGCITMLGWRQLSHTPDQAAVNVLREYTSQKDIGIMQCLCSETFNRLTGGLFSSLTHHLKESSQKYFLLLCYFIDEETEAHPGLLGYWL